MTPPSPPASSRAHLPIPLTIDVDQWQRDIDTFRKMTNSELRKIVFELSLHCKDGFAANSPSGFFDSYSQHSSSTFVEAGLDAHDEQRSPGNNRRLAKLEQALTRKISTDCHSARGPSES